MSKPNFPILLKQGVHTKSEADRLARELRYKHNLPIYRSSTTDPVLGPVWVIAVSEVVGKYPDYDSKSAPIRRMAVREGNVLSVNFRDQTRKRFA